MIWTDGGRYIGDSLLQSAAEETLGPSPESCAAPSSSDHSLLCCALRLPGDESQVGMIRRIARKRRCDHCHLRSRGQTFLEHNPSLESQWTSPSFQGGRSRRTLVTSPPLAPIRTAAPPQDPRSSRGGRGPRRQPARCRLIEPSPQLTPVDQKAGRRRFGWPLPSARKRRQQLPK